MDPAHVSRATWQYRSYGSGPGHLQRVAADIDYNRRQRAYRAYIDHTSRCPGCGPEDERCAEADALWDAYKSAGT